MNGLLSLMILSLNCPSFHSQIDLNLNNWYPAVTSDRIWAWNQSSTEISIETTGFWLSLETVIKGCFRFCYCFVLRQGLRWPRLAFNSLQSQEWPWTPDIPQPPPLKSMEICIKQYLKPFQGMLYKNILVNANEDRMRGWSECLHACESCC